MTGRKQGFVPERALAPDCEDRAGFGAALACHASGFYRHRDPLVVRLAVTARSSVRTTIIDPPTASDPHRPTATI
ncbi:hypothetical protein FP2506_00915 [Fulvimarina pelagi HTCC2506]|uniref:Uncharacterized protein n=1 Tax=Fulvimarina pelagi HTCC2506 TaxID=314231 RepID=Q0G2B4_9HYPH|nr:hypothetical protein [Fulvimarina pelagi]EAU41284.1 hypothetical protein FP2506_00915 [Fulvimarina pelagi HTCC2506]